MPDKIKRQIAFNKRMLADLNRPLVKRMLWPIDLIHLVIPLVSWKFFEKQGLHIHVFLVLLAYFALVGIANGILARPFWKGRTLARKKQYDQAFPQLVRSFEFFKRHPWLDRFLNPTRYSYNFHSRRYLARCFTYLDDVAEAEALADKYLD